MTDAIAYLRVSGLGQVEGDGFTRQLEAIRKYAQANDIAIVAEFRDEGISGKTELENRPGLAGALERVENNGVKLILVESADRLARDSMIAELIIREVQKAGGRVIAAAGGVDLTAGDDANPTAKLIRQILAAVAEFDRCVIVLKLRAARQRAKASNGKCEGKKAFGELPEEAEALRVIHTMHAHGDSSAFIAGFLNRQGLRTRSGKPWRDSVIRKILKRGNHADARTANRETESGAA